jgi:hypothetical protein
MQHPGSLTWRDLAEWVAWNNVTDDAVVVDQAGNQVTSLAPTTAARACTPRRALTTR